MPSVKPGPGRAAPPRPPPPHYLCGAAAIRLPAGRLPPSPRPVTFRNHSKQTRQIELKGMLSPQLLRQSASRSARYVAGRVRVSTLWCWRLLAKVISVLECWSPDCWASAPRPLNVRSDCRAPAAGTLHSAPQQLTRPPSWNCRHNQSRPPSLASTPGENSTNRQPYNKMQAKYFYVHCNSMNIILSAGPALR